MPGNRPRSGPRPALLLPALLACALGACTLSACTVLGAPADDAPPLAATGDASGGALPTGVPFTAGTADLLESSLLDELSRTAVGRWEVRVTASRVHSAVRTLEIVEDELADAGYRPFGGSPLGNGASSPSPQLRMQRDGTTVHVRISDELPWLVDYTVTRALGGCAGARCD
jgi:hypothetical protein